MSRSMMIRSLWNAKNQASAANWGGKRNFGEVLGLVRYGRIRSTRDLFLGDDVSVETSFSASDFLPLPEIGVKEWKVPDVALGQTSTWIKPTLPNFSATNLQPIQAADSGGGWLGSILGALTPAVSQVGGTLLNNLVSRETQKEAIKTYGTPMTEDAIQAYRNRDQLQAAQRGGTVLTAGTIGVLALGGLALIMLAKKRKSI